MSQRKPHVGLFVTCLADLFRPTVAFAAVKLLEDAGCEVVVPPNQACCGQPAYNSGDNQDARKVAAVIVDAFQDVDFLVAPSGSCAGMIRTHYPELFADDPKRTEAAKRLANRSHELVSFLVDVCGMEQVDTKLDATIAYHDSCSGLRELGVKGQPRKLLASIAGVTVTELPNAEVC
jgi:L-lactate dehydrogenase complex protein LldE